MSLGEKLLTRDYGQSNSAGAMAFYEGMASFARCEFSTAKNKYRESLTKDRNNPEALIYYNNAQAIASEHFKIAVSIPLGSKPNIAWEILRGVAQAQSEVNQQGGINQKQLLVQIVNDDNNPYVVQQLAKQLSADKNILAVVGHNDSNSSLAGAKVYQQEELVMISPTSTSTKLSGMGSHIMRTIPSVSALASKLANYASAQSLTKIAICSDSQDSASGSFAQEFITQTVTNGGQITSIDCDFAENEFQPDSIVTRAVAENVDALLVAPSVNKMDRAIAIAQANQQQLPLLGNHSLYTYKTIESGQNAIAGMVIPSPWLSDDGDQNSFPQAAVRYWGGKVNWRTAMAYDAVGAIVQGLQHSSDRAGLQSILTQSGFSVNGATGEFKFHKGDRFGQVQLAHITKTSGDRQQYQFSRLEL
ncbi:MAG: ABC transporter substrate-binding protein [Pleurocapsa sp.]